jgi:hypothetical protein
MPTDVMKLVESVVTEKTAVANKERELITGLNRVLPGIGYRVVPSGPGERRPLPSSRPARPASKALSCPHCPRTFAHPLHLGRHMSATHGVKRAHRMKGKKKGS